MGELGKISSKFILCDLVRNSHDQSVLKSIDVTRRNLVLTTVRAERVKEIFGINEKIIIVSYDVKNHLHLGDCYLPRPSPR